MVILVDTWIAMLMSLITFEQDGDTALMMAARNDLDKSVSILVANGADVNMATKVLEWVFHVCYQWELAC